MYGLFEHLRCEYCWVEQLVARFDREFRASSMRPINEYLSTWHGLSSFAARLRLSSGMSEVKVCTSSGQARAEVGMVSVQSSNSLWSELVSEL